MMWVGKPRPGAGFGSKTILAGRGTRFLSVLQIRKLRCDKWRSLSSPEPRVTEAWLATFLVSHQEQEGMETITVGSGGWGEEGAASLLLPVRPPLLTSPIFIWQGS